MVYSRNGKTVFVFENPPRLFGVSQAEMQSKLMMFSNRLSDTARKMHEYISQRKGTFYAWSSVDDDDSVPSDGPGFHMVPPGVRYVYQDL